ncbi:MAG: hypothetical protein HZB31_14910 [Nitrospirae bacterium]|nr:hypothetical protein [Nitrospirota bacterium]
MQIEPVAVGQRNTNHHFAIDEESVMRSLFSAHGDDLAGVICAARQAEVLIEAISPLIEEHTSAVCPDCTSVCCIDRHSRFDRSDVIFMTALGKKIPEKDPAVADTDACRFLGSRGCGRKRSERPYRCTWFFCSPLLDRISRQASAAWYKTFIEMLRNITEKRTTMMNDFEAISTKLSTALNNARE